ncbi:MAG TPA: RNA polymerase sigma factor [Sumerlaeia bacterium]|nr:RNA polymerase sigma factor [Sumerlaeia bacterium]
MSQLGLRWDGGEDRETGEKAVLKGNARSQAVPPRKTETPRPADVSAESVREHYVRIYDYLLHLCGDVDKAEDLCQETFIKVWEHRGRFRGKSSVLTWVFRIARNTFLDDARRESRIRLAGPTRVEWDEAEPAASAPGPSASDAAVHKEEAAMLHEAIQQLPEQQKTAVLLHYREGLSYRQLAKVLKIPAGTAKYHVSEAVARIRRILDKRERVS